MAAHGAPDRWLLTLERLLAISAGDLDVALRHACTAVGEALRADKVDAFIHDPARDSLVALGTSATELSGLERRLGLDVLQVSNGGRAVECFVHGNTFLSGNLHEDPNELRGIRVGLGIRSAIAVPLEVGGRRRGVLMIASKEPNYFDADDLQFAESVGRWVAVIAHRAQLVQEIARNATEHGRRLVAEELITVLAHDLRNYIAPVSTRLQLIQRRAMRDKRADEARDAEMAIAGMHRLDGLIRDILDVARLDQGIFNLIVQPVDLVALTNDAARAFSTPEHTVLTEHLDEEALVAADAQRLQQCVDNLLANAVQHSPHGAPIEARVWTERGDDKTWGCLEVRNEGPGIPAEVMPHIFERFSSGPTSRGLGLGLYLAQRIAVAHGGELSAVSPPGRGATFLLRLPCYQE